MSLAGRDDELHLAAEGFEAFLHLAGIGVQRDDGVDIAVDREQRDAGFGEGRAADRFVEILQDPAFWASDLQKRFHDQS